MFVHYIIIPSALQGWNQNTATVHAFIEGKNILQLVEFCVLVHRGVRPNPIHFFFKSIANFENVGAEIGFLSNIYYRMNNKSNYLR